MKHNRWSRIEGNLIIFGSLGGLGIVLWFLWCAFIFGDPLYFQRGPFSAQAQQKELISAHLLYTYHDPLQSIRYYMIDCIDTLGPVLFTLCILAIIVFVLHRRFTPEALAALAFLIPVPFYVFSLYTGQASLYLPEAVPGYASYQLFNARYGAMVVAPASLFLALLASFIVPALRQPLLHRSFIRRAGRTAGQYIGHLACVSIIIVQVVLIAQNGIITLRDGQYGLACTPTHTIVIYLSQHYAGGRILEDLYTSKIDSLEPTAGIDFKNIVYEGSSQLWIKALSHPEMVVDWIIVNPSDAGDYLARQIHLTSPAFSSHFHDLAQSDNLLNLIRIWKAGQH